MNANWSIFFTVREVKHFNGLFGEVLDLYLGCVQNSNIQAPKQHGLIKHQQEFVYMTSEVPFQSELRYSAVL